METGFLRWLHVSDLHLTGQNSYDQDRLISSLLSSLPQIVNRTGQIDAVAFTGDIANTGTEAQYQEATVFFDKLLEVLALKKDCLFLVPGNHDVDRSKNPGLLRELSTRKEIDDLFDGSEVTQIAKRQGAFLSWYEEYFEGAKFPSDSTLKKLGKKSIGEADIEFWGLNTSAFSFDDHDQGKLLVSKRSLDSAISGSPIDNRTSRVLLMHHPIDWLSEIEQSSVKAFLNSNFDVVLHGHLHQNTVEGCAGSLGSSLTIAAGATYQGTEWPNMANVCTFDGKNISIFPVRYTSEPVELWALDTSMFPDELDYTGKFSISELSRPTVREEGFAKVEATAQIVERTFEKSYPRGKWTKNLFSNPSGRVLYTEPRLFDTQQAADEDQRIAQSISVNDIISSEESIFIESRSEYGGTSLLERIISELSSQGENSVLENARTLPNYKAKLKSVLELTGKPDNSVCVILDNLDVERDTRLLSELHKIDAVKRVVVLSVNRGLMPESNADFVGQPFKFKRVHLWQLGRSDIRELTAAYFDSSDPQYISTITGKIYSDLLGLCIPLTPANILMYLRVLSSEGEFNPINRVDILNRFLTDSLRRPSDSFEGSFNFRNKLDLISQFALDVFSRKKEIFRDKDWFDFCEKYKSITLLDFGANEVLEESISAKIFGRIGDSLFFRYGFFYSFFLGRGLSENVQELNDFLDNQEYLSIENVVDVVSAFNANDPALIQKICDDIEEKIKEFSEDVAELSYDPLSTATWAVSKKEEEQTWVPITKAISDGPAEAAEIDAIKSSYFAEARTENQKTSLKKFLDLEFSLVILKRGLIDCLKNSNDVGREEKLRAYEYYLRAEFASFQVGALFAPELAKSGFYRWGAIAFIDFDKAAGDANPDSIEAISRVVVSLAKSVANKSAQDLGVAKLSGLFAVRASEVKEISFVDIMNFAHIISARGGGWMNAAKGLINIAEHSSFYMLLLLDVVLREIKSDVVRVRDREYLKELVVYIRAKRSNMVEIPTQKQLKIVSDQMDRADMLNGSG